MTYSRKNPSLLLLYHSGHKCNSFIKNNRLSFKCIEDIIAFLVCVWANFWLILMLELLLPNPELEKQFGGNKQNINSQQIGQPWR